jgi:polar amino acid transport system substrate-binding protein
MSTGWSSTRSPGDRARRHRYGPVVALLLAAVVSACSVLSTTETPLPSAAPSAAPTSAAASTAPVTCRNPVASYRPDGALPSPGKLPAGSTMAKIKARGRLIAGVSADTYLLASRNPLKGQIEGFDIDMVKAITEAIFGDDSKYELRVITAAQRIPLLSDNSVDVVVRAMTINCARWQQIAFSTEYYAAGQKILVRKGSRAKTLSDLSGQKVCAPNGTSSMDTLKAQAPKAIAVGSDSHTGCLVLFQQGDVAAITGDDTILAGLAAQDPYAVVPQQKAFTKEPYGIGVNARNVDFVRFLNARLAQMRSDGEWKTIYNRWLAKPLGPAPAPPPAVYGRNP